MSLSGAPKETEVNADAINDNEKIYSEEQSYDLVALQTSWAE